MEDTVEYIMRVRVPLSRSRTLEAWLIANAHSVGAQSLTRIQREERGTYALHKSRKKLVSHA